MNYTQDLCCSVANIGHLAVFSIQYKHRRSANNGCKWGENEMEKSLDYEQRIAVKRKANPFISQTDLVYDILLEDIMSCQRQLGSKINQDQLATALKVSRSPIREAINRLTQDGHLVKRGKRGYYVYIPTMRDVIHASEFRIAMEVNAAQLAMKRMTEEDLRQLQSIIDEHANCSRQVLGEMISLDIAFHDRLVACSRSDYIIQAYRQYEKKFQQIHNRITVMSMQDIILAHHKDIVYAITNRDTVHLESALRVHLNHAEDFIQAPERNYE